MIRCSTKHRLIEGNSRNMGAFARANSFTESANCASLKDPHHTCYNCEVSKGKRLHTSSQVTASFGGCWDFQDFRIPWVPNQTKQRNNATDHLRLGFRVIVVNSVYVCRETSKAMKFRSSACLDHQLDLVSRQYQHNLCNNLCRCAILEYVDKILRLHNRSKQPYLGTKNNHLNALGQDLKARHQNTVFRNMCNV